MRINDIINETNELNEKPVSMIGQMARKAGAKTLAKLGAKDMAAGIAGTVDAGERAKKIYRAWRTYLGKIKTKEGQATAGNLADFFTQQHLSTSHIDALGNDAAVITSKQVDDIINKTVTDTYKGDRGKAGAAQQQTLGQEFGSGGAKTVGKTASGKDVNFSPETQQLLDKAKKDPAVMAALRKGLGI